jgi:putative transposase
MFGCRRFVYNFMVGLCRELYIINQPYPGKFTLTTLVRELQIKYPFLKSASANELQHVADDYDKAMQRLFKGEGGHPKFKKKSGKATISCSQNVTYKDGKVNIEFLRDIKAVIGKQKLPTGKLLKVTITRVPSGKYFAGLTYEVEAPPTPYIPKGVDGQDQGVRDILVTDKGKFYQAAKPFRKAKKKLRRQQRALSRKYRVRKASGKKGKSNNYIKNQFQVAKTHEKIKNIRKFSLDLLADNKVKKAKRKNHALGIQCINVKGMLRNHKLALSIADAGMSYFTLREKIECIEHGVPFFEVDNWQATSKLCSHCFNHTQLELKVINWKCPSCGHKHHRDINAAKVVKAIVEGYLGLRQLYRIEYKDGNRVGNTRIYACMTDDEKLSLSENPPTTLGRDSSGGKDGVIQNLPPGAVHDLVEAEEVAKRAGDEVSNNLIPHRSPSKQETRTSTGRAKGNHSSK